MNIEFFPQQNIILQIGPVSLYFYGAMYALAGIFAYLLIRFWAKKKGLTSSSETILDLVFWSFIGGVLGARIFYVLVYNLPYFLDYPLQIFAVWNGGMSIHGGLIGGAIGFLLFCKKKKLDAMKFADISVVALALGMALGRLGNFVNGELPGRVTDHSIGMDFGDGENRHPAQLYAVAKDLILFTMFSFVLWKIQWKKYTGLVISCFLMAYAVFRFTVEFFREPDAQLGFIVSWITMGQILSLILFGVGLTLLIFRYNNPLSSESKK